MEKHIRQQGERGGEVQEIKDDKAKLKQNNKFADAHRWWEGTSAEYKIIFQCT